MSKSDKVMVALQEIVRIEKARQQAMRDLESALGQSITAAQTVALNAHVGMMTLRPGPLAYSFELSEMLADMGVKL